MPRQDWHQLPAGLRAAVAEQTGPILDVTPVNAGSASDVVAILHTDAGDVFCKGAPTDHPQVRMHWREARLNQHLPSFAPRLRWQVEADGWVLNGFDRAQGRHVDVAPGTPDLPLLATTLSAMSRTAAPGLVQPATARWPNISPDVVDGLALIHADVTPKNFLIDDGTIAVVDWSAPCRGAAWIDTALMVVRLIRAGHTPAEAEEWARQIPAWTDGAAVSVFAAAHAERLVARRSSAVHLRELADAASRWAEFRSLVPTALR